MGSTGIGAGIAIPHGRIDDAFAPTAVLMTFSEPIPFDSIDNQPVDLLFALLVPESECKQHLKTLSLMASNWLTRPSAASCARRPATKNSIRS